MAARIPITEKSIATHEATLITSWAEARERLAGAGEYWLATVREDGRPHVMPVLGVWVDDALYFTSNPNAQKAKNLAQNPYCVITTSVKGLDLVIEGKAVKVGDEAKLHRVAEAYADKYDWHVRIQHGAFDADYGAPSAGPPPYEVYEVQVIKGFGFDTNAPHGATRWQFS